MRGCKGEVEMLGERRESEIRSLAVLPDVLLSCVKAKAAEGMRIGILDSTHNSTESGVEASVLLGEMLARRKWVGEVYTEIRKSLYPEACGVLGLTHKALISGRVCLASRASNLATMDGLESVAA